MDNINTLLAYNSSLKIIQKDDTFNFSTDSTILSFFAKDSVRSGKTIDLGSGTGAIPLFMSMFRKDKIYGVEIQENIALMSKESIKLNNLESQIEILIDDIKGISKKFNPSEFNLVLSNPPYFRVEDTNIKNENEALLIARHEVKITMEDIIKEAKTLLKDNGSLCMVQRSDRFLETIFLLNKYGFTLKRLRFVYPKPNKESHIFLFDARKTNKTHGLKVLEPLYIYNKNDDFSDEMKEMYHYGE